MNSLTQLMSQIFFTYVTIAELASYIDKKTKASQKRDAAHSLEEIMLLLASGEISMEEAEELKNISFSR